MSVEASAQRSIDLERFYRALDRLARHLGGARTLAQCSGRMDWPTRGVYFFFEPGESRSSSGVGLRVVRVGTHALKQSSRTTLWNRLSQHRGQTSGTGNHRGSIFRLIVGTALIARDQYVYPTWGAGSSAGREVREIETAMERLVSEQIGSMSVLWLGIDDPAGPNSLRGYVERNAIGLLSNYGRVPLDAPSPNWLGRFCDRARVRESGLWNQNHVDEGYESNFVDKLEHLIARQDRGS